MSYLSLLKETHRAVRNTRPAKELCHATCSIVPVAKYDAECGHPKRLFLAQEVKIKQDTGSVTSELCLHKSRAILTDGGKTLPTNCAIPIHSFRLESSALHPFDHFKPALKVGAGETAIFLLR
jgi:hypothetical protein